MRKKYTERQRAREGKRKPASKKVTDKQKESEIEREKERQREGEKQRKRKRGREKEGRESTTNKEKK